MVRNPPLPPNYDWIDMDKIKNLPPTTGTISRFPSKNDDHPMITTTGYMSHSDNTINFKSSDNLTNVLVGYCNDSRIICEKCGIEYDSHIKHECIDFYIAQEYQQISMCQYCGLTPCICKEETEKLVDRIETIVSRKERKTKKYLKWLKTIYKTKKEERHQKRLKEYFDSGIGIRHRP